MSTHRLTAPGPFRADQIRDGDYYELSNGHAIALAPAGSRHGAATSAAAMVIQTDPAVAHAGVDVGFSNKPGNLRAPDVSVLPGPPGPGWAQGAPPLAIEYADTGQDEAGLREKIEDLLSQGTRYMWVVRLNGPRRVEVWTRDGMTIATAGEELLAPGVLANPVLVDALYDEQAAMEQSLRNLLAREGYSSLQQVHDQGREEGREEGERLALRATIEALAHARGRALTADEQYRLANSDSAELRAWIVAGV